SIVMTEAGRGSWYDAEGRPMDAYVVGVAGGSASGKTSVAKSILRALPNVPWVAIVSQDSFYKSLDAQQSRLAHANNYDFDHPNAFDYKILYECVRDLKRSRAVEIPTYSFVEHQRMKQTSYMYGATVLIVEGIFVLHDPAIRDLLDLKIFVQADSDLMLARRIRRDIAERGRDVGGVLDQYLRFVKPSYDNFVSATSKYADIIVPGQRNEVAIDVISQHIKRQLSSRATRLRSELSMTPATPRREVRQSPFEMSPLPMARTGSSALAIPEDQLPPNVDLLAQTPQLQALLTTMHDKTVRGEDFIFTIDRVAALVLERATVHLPHREKKITLFSGKSHIGCEVAAENICSVSILRSGAILEPSARRAIPALQAGSLLIQSDREGEPKLYTVDLPRFLRSPTNAQSAWVLLLDSQLGTGAAALMGVRVLLDHNVKEEHIIFVTLLASARGGVHALHRAFPRVKIVVGGVDPDLKRRVVP
ncbi:uridine kinase, partial [Ceraceosorus guamensis]